MKKTLLFATAIAAMAPSQSQAIDFHLPHLSAPKIFNCPDKSIACFAIDEQGTEHLIGYYTLNFVSSKSIANLGACRVCTEDDGCGLHITRAMNKCDEEAKKKGYPAGFLKKETAESGWTWHDINKGASEMLDTAEKAAKVAADFAAVASKGQEINAARQNAAVPTPSSPEAHSEQEHQHQQQSVEHPQAAPTQSVTKPAEQSWTAAKPTQQQAAPAPTAPKIGEHRQSAPALPAPKPAEQSWTAAKPKVLEQPDHHAAENHSDHRLEGTRPELHTPPHEGHHENREQAAPAA